MNTKAAVLATVAVIALAGAGQCRAELTATSATSFTSTFRSEVAVSQATAWRAITQLPRWWNDQHTWSGQAANMVLELHAGGCWCERWGEGRSVMHGQVVWVQPGQALRLNAALGPLQELGAGGVFTGAGLCADGFDRPVRSSRPRSGWRSGMLSFQPMSMTSGSVRWSAPGWRMPVDARKISG